MFSSSKTASTQLFIALSILTGLIGAFVHPLMSYFLVDELTMPPMYIGLYTVSVTLSGLVLSQWFGALADRGRSARKLYLIATSGTVCALLMFINTTSFLWILFGGVVFMAVGNGTIPQMLTMSRQWAGNNKLNITLFNARIRASMSFAWMLGPPIGFMLVASIGFSSSFILAMLFAVLGMLFVVFFVPEHQPKKEEPSPEKAVQAAKANKAPLSFWFLGGAVVMGATSNIMYSSALPLYTLNELNLPSYTPGVLMGLVACIEIPVMLYASRLSRTIAKHHLMTLSFVFGISFYLGVFYATQLWHFVVLQAVNAIFYGLYAGIGLTLMQEQLPHRIGFTSAFYSNAMKIGMMLGSSGAGFIAQMSSFQYANIGAAFAALLGIICLFVFSQLKTQATP